MLVDALSNINEWNLIVQCYYEFRWLITGSPVRPHFLHYKSPQSNQWLLGKFGLGLYHCLSPVTEAWSWQLSTCTEIQCCDIVNNVLHHIWWFIEIGDLTLLVFALLKQVLIYITYGGTVVNGVVFNQPLQ